MVGIEVGGNLIGQLGQDALCKSHAASLEISKRHKLDDVSGGDIPVWRSQKLVITVQELHGTEICPSHPDDDDGHGQTRRFDDGGACQVHVGDHAVCDDEQHKVLRGNILPKSLFGKAGHMVDDGREVCGTPELQPRETPLAGGAAVLIGLPSLSWLLREACHRMEQSAVVHALEKEEVLEQADYLYSSAETEKLYQLLLQHKNSDDAEFLWRLARASRDLSLLPDLEAERKKKLVYEAFEYAKKALEKDEQNFAAHKWYGICLSDVGDYEGVKVKIGNSYIIRQHLEKAIELNPKDATSLHILGYWCFAFAELPWYQRKVAAVIFASPPTSTYQEALEFFLKAEEVDPNFYSKNLLMLGRTYLAMNDKDKAQLWLNKAKEYPPHTHEDKEVHKEAVDLLKKNFG